MAFFGAPVKNKNDSYQAVMSGIKMLDSLNAFNKKQKLKNRPEFQIGIGISFGDVIVGNIGSDKKMDYTVIGNMVNLSSKLEELTKIYKKPLIISESVFKKVNKDIPCRMLDYVRIKAKQKGIRIYTPNEKLNKREKLAWKYHKDGLMLFYERKFEQAFELFVKVLEILPMDRCSKIFIERCKHFKNAPPSKDWDGIIDM